MMRHFLTFSLLLMLFACQSNTQNSTQYFVDKQTKITLPSLEGIPSLDTQQLLHIAYPQQKKDAALLVALQTSPQQIKLTLLSTLGIKLAQATYDGKQIHVEKQLHLGKMPPANQVLGDILLILLPTHRWQLPDGWMLLDENGHRTLYDDKQQKVISIRYEKWQLEQNTYLEHHKFNYKIHIKTLSIAHKK